MSATGRGAVRVTSDYYPTPDAATDALLAWAERTGLLDDVMRVVDPCAGDGAILRRVKHRYAMAVVAVELREECRFELEMSGVGSIHIGDALDRSNPEVRHAVRQSYTAVVTNPPFSLAREFVEHYRDAGQFAAFLLRLPFLGSQARAPWWVANPPAHVLVLPERPAFVAVCKGRSKPKAKGCGRSYPLGTRGACACGGAIGDGTDNTEYAWFVWRGHTGRGQTCIDWHVASRDDAMDGRR